MVLNTKKYNREIEALRAVSQQEVGLHPLRLAQLKQELMQRLELPAEPASAFVRLLQETRRTPLFLRYVLPTVLGISLVGGTVLASNSALPGNTLYPVKRLKEKVELSLTVSAKAHAEVHADHARERLNELTQVQAAVTTEARIQSVPIAAVVPTASQPTQEVLSTVPSIEEVRRDNPREAEARAKARVEVEGALINLAQVRAKLEAKGNLTAAREVGSNIKRLRAEARQHRVEVQFRDEDEVLPLDDSSSPTKNSKQQNGQGNRTDD